MLKLRALNQKVNNNILKDPNLIYVGRIINWKRIHLAIESVNWLRNNQFPNTILKIVGPVSSKKYYNELIRLIGHYRLEKNILFLGEKKHTDLIKLYREADLLLLPSNLETFGMVMIESMACGTPVAAIDSRGGPNDVIKNNINGIICEIKDYYQNIENYFKNKVLRDKIIKNAINTVNNNYTIQNTYGVLFNSLKN